MAQVNKKKLPEGLRQEAWRRFARLTGGAASEEARHARLRALFTPTELIALEKRLAILILLERGKSYRAIGRIIDVTRSTVSAVKRGRENPPARARPYTPLPPLKLNENHWMKRKERGKKRYYMGARVV
jgi:uncharacterized protein YerC